MGIECYCESRMYKTNANSRPLERHLINLQLVGWGAGGLGGRCAGHISPG